MENRKIKILHFPIRNSNGGVTRSAMKLWKFIDHGMFQFDFATCSAKLDFEQDIIDQGCKVHYISCYAEQNLEQFCNEFRRILKDGYDVVHLNTSWWKSFEAEKIAKEVGVKVVLVHARNTFIDVNDDEQREKEIVIHEKLKGEFSEEIADRFLACSNMAADFLFGPQIPKSKITIFHNALDIDKYAYNESQRERMRSKLNVAENFVIGMTGRMAYQKNHRFLIECFYEVSQKNERAVLLLLGDGILEKEIRDQVMKYKIEDKVIFVGAVDNVEDYLQAMDVFAFPTLFEGLPNALIEAQTSGLKCVCSDRITREVKITDNLVFVELDKLKWVNALLAYSSGYIRTRVDDQIREAGYDIRHEIKQLEKIYSNLE